MWVLINEKPIENNPIHFVVDKSQEEQKKFQELCQKEQTRLETQQQEFKEMEYELKRKMVQLEQKEFDDQRKKNTDKRAVETMKYFEQQQMLKQKLEEMESKLDQCRTGGGYDIVKAERIKQQYVQFLQQYELMSGKYEKAKTQVVEISPYSQIYMKKKDGPKPSFSPAGGIGSFLVNQPPEPKKSAKQKAQTLPTEQDSPQSLHYVQIGQSPLTLSRNLNPQQPLHQPAHSQIVQSQMTSPRKIVRSRINITQVTQATVQTETSPDYRSEATEKQTPHQSSIKNQLLKLQQKLTFQPPTLRKQDSFHQFLQSRPQSRNQGAGNIFRHAATPSRARQMYGIGNVNPIISGAQSQMKSLSLPKKAVGSSLERSSLIRNSNANLRAQK